LQVPSRSAWFSLHRWLGIGLGLWFALVGLSGALLVYEDVLDAWLNPRLLQTAARGPALTPGAIVQRAEDAYPLGQIERLRWPVADGEVYRLTLRVRPLRVGAERVEATFDPVSGEHLGARPLEPLGLTPPHLMRTIYEFHRNVLLGPVGSNIVGIAGLLLLTSALSGFILAAPRSRGALRRLVHVNPRTSATRIAFDTHRSLGILFALTLLLATATGATLVYLNYVRDIVSVFSKVAPFPTVPWRSGEPSAPLSVDELVAVVNRAYPAHTLLEMRGSPDQVAGRIFHLTQPGDVHRAGDTLVWVSPLSGEILVDRSRRTRNAGETFMHWLFPLHSGTAFGAPGMVIMCVTGVIPMLLVATGLWVWLRKRRGEKISRDRRLVRAVAPSATREARQGNQ
jgi:uncharacterized iron-regulated membrane protein